MVYFVVQSKFGSILLILKKYKLLIIFIVSKKQGVAHAEASFLGGREKQNGLVDVQWEKGVKKQPSQKAGDNFPPSEAGHGTGAGVQVHILATSMQGFRIFTKELEFSPSATSVLSSEIWHVSYTLILQHCLYCMHTYPGLQSVVFIRFWIVNPFQNCLLMLSKLSDSVLRIDDPDDGRTRQQLIDIRQKWG